MAYARYDRPGVAGPWETAHVRIWDNDGEREYSFETSRGDEHLGTKDEAIDLFFAFHRRLPKEGFKRMEFSLRFTPILLFRYTGKEELHAPSHRTGMNLFVCM